MAAETADREAIGIGRSVTNGGHMPGNYAGDATARAVRRRRCASPCARGVRSDLRTLPVGALLFVPHHRGLSRTGARVTTECAARRRDAIPARIPDRLSRGGRLPARRAALARGAVGRTATN